MRHYFMKFVRPKRGRDAIETNSANDADELA
jgi:hypothetical protein